MEKWFKRVFIVTGFLLALDTATTVIGLTRYPGVMVETNPALSWVDAGNAHFLQVMDILVYGGAWWVQEQLTATRIGPYSNVFLTLFLIQVGAMSLVASYFNVVQIKGLL